MVEKVYNVLFLDRTCATRALIAEACLKRLGVGRFQAFSAGLEPAEEIHPYTIDLLKHFNYKVDDLSPASWDRFTQADSPAMDFIFTLADTVVAKAQADWPGDPIEAHWGFSDPAAVTGNEALRREAFMRAYGEIERRISIFVNLPFHSLDRLKLSQQVKAMGGKAATAAA